MRPMPLGVRVFSLHENSRQAIPSKELTRICKMRENRVALSLILYTVKRLLWRIWQVVLELGVLRMIVRVRAPGTAFGSPCP